MNSTKIVCPFCPLHCDDVSIESPPNCWILKEALARIEADTCIARICDAQVTLEQAEQVAKQRVKESSLVMLSVRSATLGQAKAIVKSGWRVSMQSSPTARAVQRTIARCGVVAATLADVKQHADAIVVLGDIDKSVPRLVQKLGSSATIDVLDADELSANAIAELSASIREGRRYTDNTYVAFILDIEAFAKEDADPVVELLIETIIWMNSSAREKAQRAVLVTLDPLASLRCVSAWSNDQRLLVTDDFENAGLTIQLGELPSDRAPVGIQIGGSDPGPSRAEVYLPASTAGIHHADAVIRGDSTVTLPLEKLQVSSVPSVADWIARLS